MIWHVVTRHARKIGIRELAPHDLRRTCAKLFSSVGGDLEQIPFLLGHSSIQTTERYLGSKQNLREAVNDKLGIEGTGVPPGVNSGSPAVFNVLVALHLNTKQPWIEACLCILFVERPSHAAGLRRIPQLEHGKEWGGMPK